MASNSLVKGKNILITGIGGFIGSNLAKTLAKNGANVVGIVRTTAPMFTKQEVFVGDVCDYGFLREVISSKEIDFVYHLAAYSIVRISASDPLSTYSVNVMGTVNLLEAVRNIGKKIPVIVASSDKAYGDHAVLPYLETHALQPKNTYDTSKACMDMIARSYAHNYDMPILVSRCSNVYGPGDLNMSRIVPNSIMRLFSGKPPMLYSDIESMEREFIFIGDVCRAYLDLAMVVLSDEAFNGEAFNVGGTGPVKIRDLAKMICDEVGSPLDPQIVPRDPIFREIGKQYIDASKLNELTGWKPETTLREGIAKTVKWYDEYRKNLP
jgi:CDP-glucose 4,6-dehydratase